MYKEFSILEFFFEDPLNGFHIRQIARLTKINHMTIRRYLNKFTKEGLLIKKKNSIYPLYYANAPNIQFRNLKLCYNLEKLRMSKIIENLEEIYDYPVIVLFGSYSSATNTKNSDIDICIITNVKKDIDLSKYLTTLKREISIHKFTEKEFNGMKMKNPELVNNMCNGIVLSGKLEVV